MIMLKVERTTYMEQYLKNLFFSILSDVELLHNQEFDP